MNYDQPSDINTIYADFVSTFPQKKQIILNRKKDLILQTIFNNMGLKFKTFYSIEESDNIASELRQSVYAVGHRLTTLMEDNGSLVVTNTLQENAKNIAKHLILGVVAGENGADILDSPLANPRNIMALFKKHDPELLTALRIEFQYFLTKISKPAVDSGVVAEPADEKQLIAFVHSCLGLYPILEPANGERITVPKKLSSGVWTAVEYEFERIDISPQSGVIAALLTDNMDRMYAYGLASISNPEASSYLLFSGTTFPTGQGVHLAEISNLTPKYSSGESHDMSLVEKWLNSQTKKVITAGQSQGAVLAMLTAARYPDNVDTAYCLNPTALSKHTLGRVLPRWNAIREEQRPSVIIYTQHKDPVFGLEKWFLPGKNTHIFKIIPDMDEPSINASITSLVPEIIPQSLLKRLTPKLAQAYEAHVHLYSGRREIVMVELNLARENARLFREVSSNIKLLACELIFFPIKQVQLVNHLCKKKYNLSDLEKYGAYTLMTLISGVFLNETWKQTALAQGLLCCMVLYLLVSQIEGVVSFRRAQLSAKPMGQSPGQLHINKA